MAKGGSLKSTLAVSLNNYLDAGAIVAGASGVTLWQNYRCHYRRIPGR